jgi:DNA-binding transcriptional MerR regulator
VTPHGSGWLKTSDLASRWPIPESTWRYWRHRGYGPPSVKVGRHVLYRQEDIESWLDELQTAQRSAAVDRSHP